MGGRGGQISEFKVSLVYRVSSRMSRVTKRNPILKRKEGRTEGRKEKRTERKKEGRKRKGALESCTGQNRKN